jgi:ATP-dependent RNA helicase RhlE
VSHQGVSWLFYFQAAPLKAKPEPEKGFFVNFNEFPFHPQIKAGITAAGYVTPTPIQLKAIPPILQGKDLLGLAQTGTGKTAAFVLPILQHLMKGPRGKLRALILAPTRELAEQTHTAIGALGRQTGLRSVTLYGGVGVQPQIQRLQAGADIAVACPGRLLDLIGQKAVDLRNIELLVLDEADQMFDMGFLPDVRRILAVLPTRRQTLLFSATMPDEIRSLTQTVLHDPETVEIGNLRPVDTVSHYAYTVDQEQKYAVLQALLSQAGSGQVLVFARTKHGAKKLAEKLTRSGVAATSLQGNLSQNRRMEAMDDFRSGRARVMVATDIAARGIDVSKITYVINFDMPNTAETYTHRTGRTGRMEHLGSAFSLVTHDDLPMIRAIERLMGRPIQRRKMEGIAPTPVPVGPKSAPAASALAASAPAASAQTAAPRSQNSRPESLRSNPDHANAAHAQTGRTSRPRPQSNPRRRAEVSRSAS